MDLDNVYSFRILDPNIENIVTRGGLPFLEDSSPSARNSYNVLLHMPEGIAYAEKYHQNPEDWFRKCKDPYYEIDLSGEEVLAVMFNPRGLRAHVGIIASRRYVFTGAESQKIEKLYPFMHLYPHQCAVNWFLAEVMSRDEVISMLSKGYRPEANIFTEVESWVSEMAGVRDSSKRSVFQAKLTGHEKSRVLRVTGDSFPGFGHSDGSERYSYKPTSDADIQMLLDHGIIP